MDKKLYFGELKIIIFLKNAPPDSSFLMYCHSQGCIHVANALSSYNEEYRQRIFVVGIAPAGYADSNHCKDSVFYRVPCTRDLIPLFHFKGRMRERERIHTLPSHIDAEFHDHPFNSPTHKPVIIEHFDKFFKNNGTKI